MKHAFTSVSILLYFHSLVALLELKKKSLFYFERRQTFISIEVFPETLIAIFLTP